MGEYEPNDSRNVTGAGNGAPQQSGIRSPGGADQQEGGARWNGDGQMNQQQGSQGQMGGADANSGTEGQDRKSTRLNSSHVSESRMPSSA